MLDSLRILLSFGGLIGMLSGIAGMPGASAEEAQPTPEQVEFFEKKIRPILAENCQKCHGEQKHNGNLRLDSKAAIVAGGDSGPSVVPGKPEESLLIQAVNYESLEMPPDARLKSAQIALLTEWVKMGAPWPGGAEGAPAPRKGPLQVTSADRQFWSFRPISNPPLPETSVQDSGAHSQAPQTSIDAFVRHTLNEKRLAPSPQARPRELLRRVSFDLIGLPPSYEEVEDFAADSSPDAFERRVDRLLATPRHGERWGRHWLDIVRFAQTNGYERDDEKPHAWRYRDYVIGAFNGDKPYDRFLVEQLAGDELTPVTDDSLAATAYYRIGVWDDEPDDPRQADADELDDIVSTTGLAMLGLTIGCARCHDHKFDPIGQEDYYSFTSFFANIHRYGKMAETVGGGQPVNKEGIFRELPSGSGQTLCVSERSEPPKPTHVLIRGDAGSPGKEVQPRFVEVLCSRKEDTVPSLPETTSLPGTGSGAANSTTTNGRRSALARWIASPENPLTARVIVNRLWHHHFGRGIVATPSDFGHTGLIPSHPELLDHLASDLIRGNWELKRVHRRIVSSASYRQSSREESQRHQAQGQSQHSQFADPQLVDPDNTLLWRQNMRRIEAEAIRDAMLFTTGSLNLEMNGRGIFPTLSPEVLSSQSRPGSGWENNQPLAQQSRRSVYIFVKRTLGVPLLESFDAASPDTPTARRNVTTVAPQALILLNSAFVEQQAVKMAQSIASEAPADPDSQITLAYQRALGRLPSDAERRVASAYLAREQNRWSQLAKQRPELFVPSTDSIVVRIDGWEQFGGNWQFRSDKGLEVDADPGAKVLHETLEVNDGTVEAQVMLLEGEGDAGVLVRVSQAENGVNALHGYNVNLKKDQVRLGKHQNDWQPLATRSIDLPPNQWHDVKIVLEGARLRVYLNGAEEPQIDFTDDKPLLTGKIGFRTYAISSAVRGFRVQKGERSLTPEFRAAPPPVSSLPTAHGRALTSLCKLVLNLNEFVYVD